MPPHAPEQREAYYQSLSTHSLSPIDTHTQISPASRSTTVDPSSGIKKRKNQPNHTVKKIHNAMVSGMDIASERNVSYLFFICCFFFLMQMWGLRFINILSNTQYSKPFNLENPNLSWCPYAKCHNSPMCSPCRRKFLIIIATGRSGSTTLTNMLDLLPDVRMAGENNGHLLFGLQALENLKNTRNFKLRSKETVTGAWKHHAIPEGSISCPIQNMFENMNPPPPEVLSLRKGFDDSDTIIGFKTVRFHDKRFGDSFERSTDFLMEAFPCAKFIINIRGDIDSQIRSWENAFGSKMEEDEIRTYNTRLEKVADRLGPNRARMIDMSEWSKEDGSGLHVLNDLLDWMGFQGCQYDKLLHSNKDGYAQDGTRVNLGKKCRAPGKQ